MAKKLKKTQVFSSACKYFAKNSIEYHILSILSGPNLENSDIFYDKVFTNSLHEKIESFQYNSCLDLTRDNRGRLQRVSLNPSRPNPGQREKGLKGLHKTF